MFGMFYCFVMVFFFFKQKTAYELRISDWSSDVCSSDLGHAQRAGLRIEQAVMEFQLATLGQLDAAFHADQVTGVQLGQVIDLGKIGRASCRERVCQYV